MKNLKKNIEKKHESNNITKFYLYFIKNSIVLKFLLYNSQNFMQYYKPITITVH